MGEPIETYCSDGVWRNRVAGRDPLPGEYEIRESAIEVGRGEARIRGVEHIIRRADHTVADRRRYPRLADEIPG